MHMEQVWTLWHPFLPPMRTMILNWARSSQKPTGGRALATTRQPTTLVTLGPRGIRHPTRNTKGQPRSTLEQTPRAQHTQESSDRDSQGHSGHIGRHHKPSTQAGASRETAPGSPWTIKAREVRTPGRTLSNSLAGPAPEDKAQAQPGDSPQAAPGIQDPSTQITLPKTTVVRTQVAHLATQKATMRIPCMVRPMVSPQVAPGNQGPSTQIPLPASATGDTSGHKEGRHKQSTYGSASGQST